MDIRNVQFGHGRSKFVKAYTVVYLNKGLCRKKILLISIIVSELWTFEIFYLASEVNFDLRGRISFWTEVAYLIKELYRKIFVRISAMTSEL